MQRHSQSLVSKSSRNIFLTRHGREHLLVDDEVCDCRMLKTLPGSAMAGAAASSNSALRCRGRSTRQGSKSFVQGKRMLVYTICKSQPGRRAGPPGTQGLMRSAARSAARSAVLRDAASEAASADAHHAGRVVPVLGRHALPQLLRVLHGHAVQGVHDVDVGGRHLLRCSTNKTARARRQLTPAAAAALLFLGQPAAAP